MSFPFTSYVQYRNGAFPAVTGHRRRRFFLVSS
ncbi:hypothetical protein TorRG33x02_351360 [Trema orientale]|uniref:Uncharacterized protein n=1 Tax=Trema orientale TaxID=63057 RepID=A0A2P5AFZ1_TREOI|nr:hypothetical protein TorRG33x02_351360 [Trema orientale]